jgi:hypothetical protein
MKWKQRACEPDIVGYDKKTNEYIFYDCSAESPKGRRSICYDHEALEARKENKPKNSAIEMASDMGIEILTEEQYRVLQELGNFDMKTSSWILTPPAIRKLGGAVFCDRRYDTVFLYHNGADSLLCRQGLPWLVKRLIHIAFKITTNYNNEYNESKVDFYFDKATKWQKELKQLRKIVLTVVSQKN